MSEFEDYIKKNFPRDYDLTKRAYPDQSIENLYSEEFGLWQHQQAKINQHQLEIHALGEANLNQAMMLAKKQEEIDSLKSQLNNMEACYIGVKKERDELQSQVDRVLATMQYNLGHNDYEDMRNPDYHTMLSCLIEIKSLFKKPLRGEHE